jgi:hypothetical protein
MLYESVYPVFTYLRIEAREMTVNFNTFPEQPCLAFKIREVKL